MFPGRVGSRHRGSLVLCGARVEGPGAGAQGAASLAGEGAGARAAARREVRGSAWSAARRQAPPPSQPAPPERPSNATPPPRPAAARRPRLRLTPSAALASPLTPRTGLPVLQCVCLDPSHASKPHPSLDKPGSASEGPREPRSCLLLPSGTLLAQPS